MQVIQFRYSSDNFGYLICGPESAMAIDGGAIEAITAYLAENRLRLKYVANTHVHPDHTLGNHVLVSKSSAVLLGGQDLDENQPIELDGELISVYRTPGHTEDSVCFHADPYLLSGDTLFNGTVGNCFSGDLKAFYHSIKKLMALPPETIVYAGHDYVKASLRFAKTLEPDNPKLDEFLSRYDPAHVYSTLAWEFAINPYLRFNQKPIIDFLVQRGLAVGSEYERWLAIMSIE
jgi:hydroxyacylglutathione hydrolase